jgi:hypothetical protein
MGNPLYVLIIPSEYFVAASYIAGTAFMLRSLRPHQADREPDVRSVCQVLGLDHSCLPLSALCSVSLILG